MELHTLWILDPASMHIGSKQLRGQVHLMGLTFCLGSSGLMRSGPLSGSELLFGWSVCGACAGEAVGFGLTMVWNALVPRARCCCSVVRIAVSSSSLMASRRKMRHHWARSAGVLPLAS